MQQDPTLCLNLCALYNILSENTFLTAVWKHFLQRISLFLELISLVPFPGLLQTYEFHFQYSEIQFQTNVNRNQCYEIEYHTTEIQFKSCAIKFQTNDIQFPTDEIHFQTSDIQFHADEIQI